VTSESPTAKELKSAGMTLGKILRWTVGVCVGVGILFEAERGVVSAYDTSIDHKIERKTKPFSDLFDWFLSVHPDATKEYNEYLKNKECHQDLLNGKSCK